MPKINERQAEIIEGAEILRNPVGTAPGQFLHHGETRIALLPGPPRELRPMFETQVIPRLAGLSGPRKMFERLLHVTGMTESEVDSKAAHIYGSYPDIRVNILASPGHIALRLRKWSVRDADVLELDELAGRLRDELGDAVFSNRGERLEEALGSMLRRAGLSLAVAESCTSGLVAARITRVPGSSDYFLGGVLCYSNLVKTALCHVPADMLHRHGAVSAEVAEALARGVREVAASRIGLSVTGIAGPGGGSPEKPVGLVFVGICDGDTCTHFCRSIPGDRETVRERTAYFALSSLRRFLLQKGIPA